MSDCCAELAEERRRSAYMEQQVEAAEAVKRAAQAELEAARSRLRWADQIIANGAKELVKATDRDSAER
jgi:hypothetical protein